MQAIARGIELRGDQVEFRDGAHGRMDLSGFDAAACWGWRRGKALRKANPGLPVLILERGYVGDRFHWVSAGWNGLNGHAKFPRPAEAPQDLGRRFVECGKTLAGCESFNMHVWRDPARDGYALILGQVQSDQACMNVNLAYQYRAWAQALRSAGYSVRYRPHPKAIAQSSGLQRGCYTRGTLAQDLAGAKFSVSWNSNSSVDSVLAGVPSVTFDMGAMAWPVTSHDLQNPVTMPSRTEWAAQLAWCQWQPSELADGTAWAAVRGVKP